MKNLTLQSGLPILTLAFPPAKIHPIGLVKERNVLTEMNVLEAAKRLTAAGTKSPKTYQSPEKLPEEVLHV